MPDSETGAAPAPVDNVVRVRTEAMIAQELRDEVAPLLAKAAEVMNKARAAGLMMNWQVSQDSFGRYRVGEINVLKPL